VKVMDIDGRELRAGDVVMWKLSDDFSPRFFVQDLVRPGAAQKNAPGKITLSVEVMIPHPEFESSVALSDIVRSDAVQQSEAAEPPPLQCCRIRSPEF